MGLLQRVSAAEVVIDGSTVGAIGRGLLVFLGFERGDAEAQVDRLTDRLLGYRVFADASGKMNLSVQDIGGALLLVPQFTLAADTRKGMRPSFTPAAPPEESQHLFELFVTKAKRRCRRVCAGRFGANMQVTLTNDGPVTFTLRVPPPVRA